MADTHKLASSNQKDPSKYYTNFLYKAAIVSVFLFILPILPSQVPVLTDRNRTWELLQLIFVGIAVSYGLFSQKNEETEKEHGSKFDNAHTYLSRFLQLSSVFDEENDYPTGFDESKIQTWSNQYYREEPALRVAQKTPVFEEHRGVNSVSAQKPLLLPVRSLKSRVSEPEITDDFDKSMAKGNYFTKSKSTPSSRLGSTRFSSNSKSYENSKIENFDDIKSRGESEENVVLRSPIPWRSRSGRMEIREEMEPIPLFSLSSETEDSVSHNYSPSPVESLGKKKNYQHKTTTAPPAPPPPPRPHLHHKPPLGKSDSFPAKKPNRREIEEIDHFEEKLVTESDEETEEKEIIRGEKEETESNGANDVGPDVNKKADEFIAKFREQIRLQRIESIKRSTGQIGIISSS